MFVQWPVSCPLAPVAHGTCFSSGSPAEVIPPGGHLLLSRASFLSSKGSFSGSKTSGKTSAQGATAKLIDNFMATELTLTFQVIPK